MNPPIPPISQIEPLATQVRTPTLCLGHCRRDGTALRHLRNLRMVLS
jgi:hypothetical protein